MSLRKQTINGLSWSIIQQYGVAIVVFITHVIISRLTTPEDLGVYGLLLVFVAIGNSISDSGMGQSIIRSDDLDEKDYGTIFTSNLILSVLIFLIIVSFSPFIADYYDNDAVTNYLIVVSLSIILTSFSTIHICRLTKMLDFKSQAIIQIPSLILSSIVGVIIAYKGYGVWSYILMAVSKNFFLSFQYWFLSGWTPKFLFDKKRFYKHFDFGYKLTISGLLSTIVTKIVHIIIGTYYSTAQLGFYTKSGDPHDMAVSSVAGVLNKVTFPLFAKVKNNKLKLLDTYKKIQNIVLFVMSPIMLCLILVGDPLFTILYGKQWLPAAYYFKIAAVTGIFYPIHIYNLNILKVAGKTNKFLIANLLKKLNLLVIIGLTCWISVEALVYGLTFHSFISLFINMYFGAKELGYTISDQFKDFVKILAPAFLLFIVFFWIQLNTNYSENLNDFCELLIIPLIFAIMYLGINIFFKTKAFKDFLYLLGSVPKVDKFANKLHYKIYNS